MRDRSQRSRTAMGHAASQRMWTRAHIEIEPGDKWDFLIACLFVFVLK